MIGADRVDEHLVVTLVRNKGHGGMSAGLLPAWTAFRRACEHGEDYLWGAGLTDSPGTRPKQSAGTLERPTGDTGLVAARLLRTLKRELDGEPQPSGMAWMSPT